MPINLQDIHFLLAVIDYPANWDGFRLTTMDSIEDLGKNLGKIRRDSIVRLRDLLSELYKEEGQLNTAPAEQQAPGSNDCALHVLNNAFRVAKVGTEVTREGLEALMA